MEQKLPTKGEVIISGLGGAGILTAGILLAEAAITKYKNVTWFPSYAISKRGGLCECTVIFSNDEVASPLLSQADGVIVAEAAQFKDFEGRVRPGGTMVVEKTGLQVKAERKDIRIIKVPAIETAINLSGTSQGANLILLGAFVGATQVISPELIKKQLKESFAGKEEVLKGNLEAFDEGLNLVEKQ
ncbi:MAG: 2-oxoacid:acceptor oxidoreductase family protein [Dehalococcoidales bacterium]|nr:2-oxoacid:acceptor oxidoreductase family protein [Dehalococcoidales bacterium]